MLAWQFSETGTIRGENQDILIVREDQGFMLLVDGDGSAGRELAHAVAYNLERKLARIPLYGRPEEAATRLREALAETARHVQEAQVAGQIDLDGGVSLVAAVVVDGHLVAARVGDAGLLAFIGGKKGAFYRLEPPNLPRLTDVLPEIMISGMGTTTDHHPMDGLKDNGSFCNGKGHDTLEFIENPRIGDSPNTNKDVRLHNYSNLVNTNILAMPSQVNVDTTYKQGALKTVENVIARLYDPELLGPVQLSVGDWVMLFSSGLLMSHTLDEVIKIAAHKVTEPQEIASVIFARAGLRYDGDDRTLALALVLPADLQPRFPPDTVLSVERNYKFSLSLWKPLALVGSAILGVCTLFFFFLRKLR